MSDRQVIDNGSHLTADERLLLGPAVEVLALDDEEALVNALVRSVEALNEVSLLPEPVV